VDSVSATRRSEIMSRVHSKNTGPEMTVRRLIHKAGFRYRLHVSNLPGQPDLVFPKRKKIIFIHGCFWHAHIGCRRARIPKSRTSFWESKFASNKARDERDILALSKNGWDVLVLWECELRDSGLLEKIKEFLS
jgi:DNA mismatch endonuclease (patch repair protein)